MSLVEIADELYGVAPGDFTAARDARAKELKATDSELSRQVKALRKPSLAAWVSNLLVRREAEQVEQVLAVGAGLREASESMSGDELRALTRQRRQLTAAVLARARGLAADEGQRLTSAVADQVEATLTAAILDADCGRALCSGLLIAPLRATGLSSDDHDAQLAAALAVPEALGFAATSRAPRKDPAPVRPDLRIVPDPDADARAREEARTALTHSQDGVDAALASCVEVEDERAELEAESLRVQSRIDEVRRELADLETEAEALDERAAEVEEVAEAVAQALAEATETRDRAAARLAALKARLDPGE